ncbi:restriction endonuclease subunit S [Clostridium botulinum]|nr:restriction endonuclease subunit S [Clostridium botulinum]
MSKVISKIKLNKVISLISGRDLIKEEYNSDHKGIPYIMGASNMNNGELCVERWTEEPAVLGVKDDIVISVKGTVGELLILKEDTVHLSRQVMSIRVSEKVNVKFMYYYLKFYLNKIKQKAKGMIPGIIREDILDADFSYMDLEEQEKVINILEKAQSLIDKRKAQIEALDELVKSRFIEMFGDPVSNPMNWEKKRLADECNIITGNTPSRKVKEYYGDYIEWIKSDNITDSSIYLTKAREYLSEKGLQLGRCVSENSILMTCIAGSIKCIGNVAIANRKVTFNQQINAIEPLENNVFFIFEQFKLSQNYIQSTINMSLKGILSKGQLSELEFIFPPLQLQNEFAEFFIRIDKLKLEMEKSLKELEDNFNSLMQKAFKGELFN